MISSPGGLVASPVWTILSSPNVPKPLDSTLKELRFHKPSWLVGKARLFTYRGWT